MNPLTEGLVIMADPDFHANWLREQERKVFRANFKARQAMQRFQPSVVSEDVIARENRHDELVELMDGYTV